MSGAQPGFFGKVPSRGDYVTQALPRSFLDPFEEWLNRAMAASQSALAAHWHELFRASPDWRFVLGSGVCGEETVAGMMLPSADRSGRCYPLVIAVALPGRPMPVEVAARTADWFERARRLGRAMIGGSVELGMLGRFLAQLGTPAATATPPPLSLGASAPGWRVAGAAPHEMHESLARLLHCVASATCLNYSLWWTEGTRRIEPSTLLCGGLPAPERFAAFLDGHWTERGWAVGA